jgi:hypothetical protein
MGLFTTIFNWLIGSKEKVERPLTEPEKAAIAAFRSLHPETEVHRTEMVVEEEDRWIVGVADGYWIPVRYKYFAVAKDTNTAQELEDDTPYRPKGILR